MAIRVSNKPVHILFAPIFWLLDNTGPKGEKPTPRNFRKCYERLAEKKEKPGGLEKRLFLEMLGGLGILGGGICWLYGYFKDSSLFKFLGGAISLGGLASGAVGIFKYFSLDFGNLFTMKKSKKKDSPGASGPAPSGGPEPSSEDEKSDKSGGPRTKKPSDSKKGSRAKGTALTVVPQDPEMPSPDEPAGGKNKDKNDKNEPDDPGLGEQLLRILKGSAKKTLKVLSGSKGTWGNAFVEAGMFIFTGPITFLAYEALKAFCGDDAQDKVFTEEEKKKNERARSEYYDSKFSQQDPHEGYNGYIKDLNKLIKTYNKEPLERVGKLGDLTEGSSDEDFKKAYKALAFKFHPDRNPGDEEAPKRFKAATEAYDFIIEYRNRKGG